jgi:hypothetical protein
MHRSKLCRVYTPITNLEWHLTDDRPTEPTLSDEHLVVTIPSYIWVSLQSTLGIVNMPPCGHTGNAQREEGPSPISPLIDTLYPVRRYGTTLAKHDLTLSPLLTRWCVRKSPMKHVEEHDEVVALRHRSVGSYPASAAGGPPTGRQFATHFRCWFGSGSGRALCGGRLRREGPGRAGGRCGGRRGERVGPTDRGAGEVPSIEGMERGF